MRGWRWIAYSNLSPRISPRYALKHYKKTRKGPKRSCSKFTVNTSLKARLPGSLILPGLLFHIWGAGTGDACQYYHLVVKKNIIIFPVLRLNVKVEMSWWYEMCQIMQLVFWWLFLMWETNSLIKTKIDARRKKT